MDIYQNGTVNSVGNSLAGVPSTTQKGIYLASRNGTSTPLIGSIAECLVFDEALSNANLNKVGKYLGKWGLSRTDI